MAGAAFAGSSATDNASMRKEESPLMWGWNDAGWAGWLLMSLMMLIFWGGLAAIVVWLIRQPQRSGGDSKPSATSILEERFARGEIDEEEFHKRRDTLLQASGRK